MSSFTPATETDIAPTPPVDNTSGNNTQGSVTTTATNTVTLSNANSPDVPTSAYSSAMYAFYATGGFSTTEEFGTIKLLSENVIYQYDLTSAIQIKFDVRTFNRKLGIFKDASNISFFNTDGTTIAKVGDGSNVSYDVSNNYFYNTSTNAQVNSITISAQDFIDGFDASSQVISVGYFNTLYSSFVSYVENYFGYAGGFASLFTSAKMFNPNGGTFDAAALVNLVQGNIPSNTATHVSGQSISDISGSITINNVVEVLRFAVDSNCFGNRNASDGTTATDTTDTNNYGVEDGFLDGDIIFIPTGLQVTMNLDIDSELYNSTAYNNTNNVGGNNVSGTGSISSNNFSVASTADSTGIQQIVKAPLVFRLTNLSSAVLTA